MGCEVSALVSHGGRELSEVPEVPVNDLERTSLQRKGGSPDSVAVKRYYIEQERYDWVSDPKYPEKLFHKWRERAILNRVRRLRPTGRVLDLGAGTGLLSRHLDGALVVGLDINRWALLRAAHHVGSGVGLVEGDAEQLPLASEALDFVLCTDVLEHLVGVQQALREISRVLRPGGILAGEVPSRHLVWRYRTRITTTCPVSEPFHNNFEAPELRALLSRFFRVVDIRSSVFGLEWFFVVEKRGVS